MKRNTYENILEKEFLITLAIFATELEKIALKGHFFPLKYCTVGHIGYRNQELKLISKSYHILLTKCLQKKLERKNGFLSKNSGYSQIFRIFSF